MYVDNRCALTTQTGFFISPVRYCAFQERRLLASLFVWTSPSNITQHFGERRLFAFWIHKNNRSATLKRAPINPDIIDDNPPWAFMGGTSHIYIIYILKCQADNVFLELKNKSIIDSKIRKCTHRLTNFNSLCRSHRGCGRL